MKVAFLIPTLHGGGAEKIASELSRNLPEEFEVVFILFEKVVGYRHRGRVISLDLPIEKNPIKNSLSFISRIFKLRKLIEKENIDVVISFDDYANILNSLAGKRPILTIHKSIIVADKLKSPFKNFMSKLLRKSYSKAHRIIAISKGILEELIDYAGIDEDKVVVINNPYNLNEIRKHADKEPELKITNDYIINIGRAEVQKGQWHLLRAFTRTHKSFPELKLVIIGRGSLSNYLKELIKDLNLEGSVVYVDRRLENVYPVLAKAKLFVLSSIFEGFPNVIVESFSLGVPVVSTNCRTGPSEIIEDGKTGFLTPVPDGKLKKYNEPLTPEENELADSVVLLLKDKKLMAKMSKNAQKKAEDFDVSIIIGKYLKIINEVYNEQ